MNRKTTIRRRYGKRALLTVALLACTGCAGGGGPSLASLNPFDNSSAASPAVASSETPALADTVAAKTQGARGQVSSMSAAVKNAYAKTSDGLAGIFAGGEDDVVDESGNRIASDDPLSLQNKPTSIGPEVYVANGQLWETSGNLEKAMEKYAMAIEIEPTNAPALASIARLKFRQTQFPEAADYFERAAKAAPSDASLYNDWGLTLSKMDQYDEASKTIQKALAISPGTSRYANNLASVQYSAGQPEKALETLKQHNKAAVAHFNMAYLEFNQGNYDKARTQLGEALKFEPQAADDAAVKRAVDRSRELLAKLDGPAGQVAAVAQTASQTYDVVKELQQPAEPAVATAPASTPASGTAHMAQPTAAPTSVNAGPFTLPPEFRLGPAAQTAELPGGTVR